MAQTRNLSLAGYRERGLYAKKRPTGCANTHHCLLHGVDRPKYAHRRYLLELESEPAAPTAAKGVETAAEGLVPVALTVALFFGIKRVLACD